MSLQELTERRIPAIAFDEQTVRRCLPVAVEAAAGCRPAPALANQFLDACRDLEALPNS
jgi:hypothetical protein